MKYEGPERRSQYIDLKDDVDKLKHLLFGNGQPGLAEQCRSMQTSVEQIKNDIKESKEVRKQIFIGVAVGVILASINLFITIKRGG